VTVNWGALAAIAEVVGALGVLASLVQLGTQIRQNTVWLRQQAFQMGTNEVRRWASHSSESNENSELFSRGQRDFSSLDPTERFRFTVWIFELCSVRRTCQQYGGDDMLGLRESAERRIGSWTARGWFGLRGEFDAYVFPPDFEVFVEDLLATRAARSDA